MSSEYCPERQLSCLDGDRNVWEEIADGQEFIQVGTYKTPSRAYVGRFNFRGPAQQQRIGDLSGGERNRVHLAKLLRSGGNVLLLDEPVSNLDHHLRSEVLRIIRSVQHEHGTTTVMVTHDQRDAAAIADRVAVMVDGAIRQVGEPSAVASAPLDDAVVRSFGDTDG